MSVPNVPRRFRACLRPLLLWLAFAGAAVGAETPGEVPVGGMLRAAQLQGLNGPSKDLQAFRGRPLLINVWASWCGPCKEEMASLERLAWHDRGQYFAIIGISTDDDADQARRLLQRTNATISHFIDTRLQMENMLGATKLPLTVPSMPTAACCARFTARDNGTAPTRCDSSRRRFGGRRSGRKIRIPGRQLEPHFDQ